LQDLLNTHDAYTRVPGLYSEDTINTVRGIMGRIGNVARHPTVHTMTGEEYQTLTSDLRRAGRSTADPQRAEAIHDIIEHLDDAMARSVATHNPADAGEWRRARDDYKRALVLERVATAAGESSARGYITPAQLERAAKAIYGARNYETGNTPFSRLGNAGAAVLKALPDSGTSQRVRIDHAISAITGAAAGGLGFHLGGAAHVADSAIGGLLLGERLGHFADAPVRAALRATLLNPASARYLGNQVAAGLPSARGSLPGLLTAVEVARQ
jgi:hypothetical protein